VGDVKQSIYGFQGADAEGLTRNQALFAADVEAARQEFRQVRLDVSFRSAPPVLRWWTRSSPGGAARAGVVPPGETLRHIPGPRRRRRPRRAVAAPGRRREGRAAALAAPENATDESGPDARLATALAARIRHMLDHERLEARHAAIRQRAAASAPATSWCWCAGATPSSPSSSAR
jgi:ATP-dependent helicase/nuclease subunit A